MYRERVRAAAYDQRHGNRGSSAKDVLRGLALLALIASAFFWVPIQWTLVGPQSYGEMFIALSQALFLVAAPPVLTSFLIPWSPGGMLLQKINGRTWGQTVVVVCSLYLVFYSYQILTAWWGSRPELSVELVRYQTIIGLIAYIIVPALLWAPVSSEELAEQLKQAQLVKRYEVQTAADIAILQTTLLRAQQKAAVGFANLAAGERAELAATLRGLVVGIDQTIQEIAGNLSQAAGVTLELRSPMDGGEVPQLLDYVAGALADGRMMAADDGGVTSPTIRAPARQDGLGHRGPDDARAMPLVTPPPVDGLARQDASNHRLVNDGIVDARASGRVAVSRPDAPGLARDGGAYAVAREKLPAIWTIKDLQTVLGDCAESTARGYRSAWEKAGQVSGNGLPNGRYQFTEGSIHD